VLIAVTGWPGESDKLRASMSGFDYYFGKPVAPADIVELVKKAQTMDHSGTSPSPVSR
jgi:DNA-binding response OmpR family regulator